MAGALTATGGVTLLVFLLVRVPAQGWDPPAALTGAALSAGLLALFAVVERRSREPLVPARLFARRGLAVAMGVTALFSATFSSVPYFLTLYFQTVHGYSAVATGLAFLVPALVIAAGTQAGERAVTAFGVHRVLVGGLALGAVGAAALGLGLTSDGSYPRLLPGIVLLGLGQGAAWTAMWIAASTGVAADDQGVASGLASTSLQVGGAVGLAVLVAIAAWRRPERPGPRAPGRHPDRRLRDGGSHRPRRARTARPPPERGDRGDRRERRSRRGPRGGRRSRRSRGDRRSRRDRSARRQRRRPPGFGERECLAAHGPEEHQCPGARSRPLCLPHLPTRAPDAVPLTPHP